MRNAGNTVQVLRNELQFVRTGGYREPLVWRAPLIFEDSPTCPKERCSACPDSGCVLLSLFRRHAVTRLPHVVIFP